MIPFSAIDAVLLLLVVAAVVWAVIERGRAERAAAEARALQRSDADVKAGVAEAARMAAGQLVERADAAFRAQSELARTQIAAQLKPVSDTLEKFEKKVTEAEQARAREAGGIKEQIANLLAASTATQEEARKLSTALRRGAGVQGRWGEHILHNVLELAGMRPGHDFVEQVQVEGQRPDVTVRLPGGVFVIDAKCSLTAYLQAQEAVDEGEREEAYRRHAASVKTHMQSLADKAYWEQFPAAPDFVAMFIPGDAFLAAAVERAPDLYSQAMERRVILVTPSSLFALCKAVVYGWRVEQQGVNAREIAALGRELYKRLSVMGGHVAGVGKALESAVDRYNRFVGSLETQVLTQARRFEDLKADTPATPIGELAAVEGTPRKLAKLALDDEAPALTPADPAPTSAP